MLRHKTYADNDSLYNTPPTYCIYMCGKVFKWLKKQGGLEAMKEINERKAKILMISWMRADCFEEPWRRRIAL